MFVYVKALKNVRQSAYRPKVTHQVLRRPQTNNYIN